MPARARPKRRTRILIADREAVFRLGLKKLFAVEDDLRVVAQAEAGDQVLGLCEKFKPEVLFVQIELMGHLPEQFLARTRERYSRGRIVVTASALAEETADRCVRAGAAGVVLKSVEPEMFVKCARKVREGEVWVPKKNLTRLAHDSANPAAPKSTRPVETLTRREKTIISCLIQGWRNREIAGHLKITEQTVKNHLRTIFDKVGVSDRLELALYAIHQQLDLPPITGE
jgi:DNA-binding NarL/FixJ family response regulator